MLENAALGSQELIALTAQPPRGGLGFSKKQHKKMVRFQPLSSMYHAFFPLFFSSYNCIILNVHTYPYKDYVDQVCPAMTLWSPSQCCQYPVCMISYPSNLTIFPKSNKYLLSSTSIVQYPVREHIILMISFLTGKLKEYPVREHIFLMISFF